MFGLRRRRGGSDEAEFRSNRAVETASGCHLVHRIYTIGYNGFFRRYPIVHPQWFLGTGAVISCRLSP